MLCTLVTLARVISETVLSIKQQSTSYCILISISYLCVKTSPVLVSTEKLPSYGIHDNLFLPHAIFVSIIQRTPVI